VYSTSKKVLSSFPDGTSFDDLFEAMLMTFQAIKDMEGRIVFSSTAGPSTSMVITSDG